MLNYRTPPDNRRLSALLAQGAQAGRGRRPASHHVFCDALMSSQMLVPITGMRENPNRLISHLEFVVIRREGRRSLPAFTDEHAKRLYFGNSRPGLYVLDGDELCYAATMAGVDSILINPAGPVGYEMPRNEFIPLCEGLSHQGDGIMSVPEGTAVHVGRPTNRPINRHSLDQMRAAVKRANVTSAYWNWVKIGDGQPQLAIVVSPPTRNVILAVQKALQTVPEGVEGYVFPFENSGVSRHIRDAGQILYKG